MKVQAYPEDGEYVLKDEEGHIYGRDKNKKHAEQVAEEWSAYYTAPLVFTATGN
jgi:hypothetical protein